MSPLALLLFAAAASAAGTAPLIRLQRRLPLLDVPNARSSHDKPKPRSGGIALFLAVATGAVLLSALNPGENLLEGLDAWVAAGTVFFFALGLSDDLLNLPEWLRLLLQLVFAALFAAYGARLEVLALPGLEWRPPPGVSVALTAFWLVGFVNLFNFMDGTDALAASEAAMVGLALYAVTPSAWALLLAGAALGFLAFNLPPSRIFMGDGGSYLLGFLIAALSVVACADGSVPFAVPVLFAGTFIADTTVTLIRRICRGEAWFRAHRSHYYQQATDLGLSHGQVALINAALTAALALGGLAYRHASPAAQWLILVAFLAGMGTLFAMMHRALR